jgi:hypothetical protein
MTVTLDLPPEIEARFIAEARQKGVPVAEVIKGHLVLSHSPVSDAPKMTAEERERALDEFFDSVDAPTGIQEAAFHRENWYR